jgi:hypothetical protein
MLAETAAISDKSVSEITSLLEKLPWSSETLHHSDYEGLTPLHFAALGSPTFCQVLCKLALDVNAQDLHGLTPLHLAHAAQNPATVEVFLAAEAKAHSSDFQGRKPADLEKMVAKKNWVRSNLLKAMNDTVSKVTARHDKMFAASIWQRHLAQLEGDNNGAVQAISRLEDYAPLILRNRKGRKITVDNISNQCLFCDAKWETNDPCLLLGCAISTRPKLRKRVKQTLSKIIGKACSNPEIASQSTNQPDELQEFIMAILKSACELPIVADKGDSAKPQPDLQHSITKLLANPDGAYRLKCMAEGQVLATVGDRVAVQYTALTRYD